MMLTVAGVSAVLRKAGFGEVNSRLMMSGFRTRHDGDAVRVRQDPRCPNDPDMHARYRRALLAAGFSVEDRGGWLVVKDKEVEVDHVHQG